MKKEEQKEEKKKKEKKKTVPCESGLGLNQEWILKNISVFKGRLPAFCPFWNSIFPHPPSPPPPHPGLWKFPFSSVDILSQF